MKEPPGGYMVTGVCTSPRDGRPTICQKKRKRRVMAHASNISRTTRAVTLPKAEGVTVEPRGRLERPTRMTRSTSAATKLKNDDSMIMPVILDGIGCKEK